VTKEERVALPRPSIDTGMGLERLSAVLQGKHNNYDIDMIRALIEAVAHETGVDPDGPQAPSHKVIADHLRASSFLIADGVLPSNEGRGYVVRRIMRRAMRHAHMLGAKDPMVYKLVPELVKQMGDAYPELVRAQPLISETLRLEETRFKQTLGTGLRLLDEETQGLSKGGVLRGDVAFKLYDTFGFPLDLTQDVLRAREIAVDTEGFDKAMDAQKAKARAAWAGSGEAANEAVWFDIREKVGATEFLGYDVEQAEGKVLAILVEGKEVSSLSQGQTGQVVVNQTPFYGESGGQMGDTGRIATSSGGDIAVTETHKKLGDLHVHNVLVEKGSLKVGDDVVLSVDGRRRSALRAHHSATHLLHEALRRHLGEHVTQKGSLVAPDRLRFDISHSKAIAFDELRAIEDEVNARIRLNTPVETRLMTPDEAIAAGAMALFGEKYGDEVRVLSMGGEGEKYSVELCGGTHARRTGDIGLFKILGEGAVAAGVRRIEAMAGVAAETYVREQGDQLVKAANALRVRPDELAPRLMVLVDAQRKLERDLGEARRALALAGSGSASKGADTGPKEVAGVKLIARRLDGVPGKDLKGMADEFKKQVGSGVVALVGIEDGKASAVIGVTDDLVGKFSAVDLVRAAVAVLGGKGGGGRPDMAQGGGPDATQADAALQAVEAAISAKVAA
jgi:alanyl-tRNA synthetase